MFGEIQFRWAETTGHARYPAQQGVEVIDRLAFDFLTGDDADAGRRILQVGGAASGRDKGGIELERRRLGVFTDLAGLCQRAEQTDASTEQKGVEQAGTDFHYTRSLSIQCTLTVR
ncbi:hypothetical protein AO265_08475 [Pseudomonas sp. ABAC61]|nr:hypothetical protein AO265_08475 [Pseudomonas sp. ABAC61]